LILLCGGCGSKPIPMPEAATVPAAGAAPGPQAGADFKNPTELSASSIQEGKVLYRRADCVLCHGQEGDGSTFYSKEVHMNVHDWRNAAYNKGFTDGQLYEVMTNGKDRMPAYGTRDTANDIWLLVDYIRSFSMK
jgi:mono/diheme cytochrome c family protein